MFQNSTISEITALYSQGKGKGPARFGFTTWLPDLIGCRRAPLIVGAIDEFACMQSRGRYLHSSLLVELASSGSRAQQREYLSRLIHVCRCRYGWRREGKEAKTCLGKRVSLSLLVERPYNLRSMARGDCLTPPSDYCRACPP